jgi:hypothetical protein
MQIQNSHENLFQQHRKKISENPSHCQMANKQKIVNVSQYKAVLKLSGVSKANQVQE